MLKEWLEYEFPDMMENIISPHTKVDDLELCGLSKALYDVVRRSRPNDPLPYSRIAEAHHLQGELREAASYYQKVLSLSPPQPLSQAETDRIYRYAPELLTTPSECFALLDVVAIHHPSQPLIAYHLFWEDDYDFPDDYEPCDHEQVWVSYDPQSDKVNQVWSFFHSQILSTSKAVEEANDRNGTARIRVEWGKHGSLPKDWENIDGVTTVLEETYKHVKAGGRVPDHPLKSWWPQAFEGSFSEYIDFSHPISTENVLREKNKIAKTYWSNAVLQQHFLLYNFHPKFDWPFSHNKREV